MPAWLDADDSVFLIVDMQERLMPAIAGQAEQVATANRLARAARLLDIPVLATAHQAAKLGGTVAPLAASVRRTFPKTHFSAAREPGFVAWLPAARRTVLVAGAEAHVCVLQTVLGLLDAGLRVVMVEDAVGSRHPADKAAALRRAAAAGADIVTAEMALFEWLGHCEHPQFPAVLALIKERPAPGV